MSTIDLRQGTKEFSVTTAVTRSGQAYMGPTVLVTARSESHALEVAKAAGHTPNEHFPPEEIKRR